MLWNEIIGQDKAKVSLLNYMQSAHLPHAILFLGKEGVGGLPLAIGFAQILLCENKLENGTVACGTCSACLKTKALVHPDLHFTFPSFPPKPGQKTNSKNFITEFREFVKESPYGNVSAWLQSIGAKDRQSGNISSEECKEMIETLSIKAMEGEYKIQIIWRPEYLGKEGNILLKLIEEPPAKTIFILVAEDTEAILETILSRTQLIKLQRLSIENIQQVLTQIYKKSDAEAQQASVLAEGNVAHALAILDETENELLPLLKEWFNGVFTYNGNLIGKWVDTVSKFSVVAQKNFLKYVQQLLGHTLRMSVMPNYRPALSNADIDFVSKLAGRKFSPQTIANMDKAIGEAMYHIERNANAKVVLLHLSVALQYAMQGSKLEA